MTEEIDTKIRLTPDILWDAGYRSLTRSQVSDLLAELYDTLELRVGYRIAEQMDSNQLAQFERLVAGHDEANAMAWLQKNFPGYKEIVRLEFQHIVNTLTSASKFRKSLETSETLTSNVEPEGQSFE